MEFELPKDFKELLELLNNHEVRYLLIGGYAVGLHGRARATNDIDIAIDADPENAEKLGRALTEFGFAGTDTPPALFMQPRSLVVMGIEPMAVDILNYLEGLTFEEAYQNRDVVKVEDIEVSLIGLDDLLKNKLAVGRHTDLADVDYLRRLHNR